MDDPPQPRLERAPGERYAARTGSPPPGQARTSGPAEPRGSRRRALTAAALVAGAGALVFLALGLLDLGAGLVAAAAAIGWCVALALHWGGGGEGIPAASRRAVIAGGLGALAIVAGLLAIWAWSRWEGGVLGPLEYLDLRFGAPLAALFVAVAGAAGALRGR